MPWLGSLAFGAVLVGTGIFVAVLTAGIDTQSEHSSVMVRVMTLIGGTIAFVATVLGIVFLVYAFGIGVEYW